MHIDMRIDMHIDMRTGIHIGMRTDIHHGTRLSSWLRLGPNYKHRWMCTDGCVAVSIDMCIAIQINDYIARGLASAATIGPPLCVGPPNLTPYMRRPGPWPVVSASARSMAPTHRHVSESVASTTGHDDVLLDFTQHFSHLCLIPECWNASFLLFHAAF